MLGNSINGSINQQKATRGYFFSLAKNNAYIPTPQELRGLAVGEKVGLSFIGWNVYRDQEVPVAPCYKISPFTSTTSSDTCEGSYPITDTTTQFVRVKTAYGVCSTTYSVRNGEFKEAHGTGVPTANRLACEMK